MSFRYSHILDNPHHVSKKRPQMSRYDRASQFASFKALTGYEDAISETARLVDERPTLTETQQFVLDSRLQMLRDFGYGEEISIVFFQKDILKEGGALIDFTGVLRIIDDAEMRLVFTDGTRIPLEDIFSLQGDFFQSLEGNSDYTTE